MYMIYIYRHTYVTCRLPLDVSTQFTCDKLPGLLSHHQASDIGTPAPTPSANLRAACGPHV